MEELMHPRAAAVPESDAARERLLNAHLLSATNQGSVTTYALRDIGLASAQPYHIRPLHQGFFRRSAPDQPCTANCSERYGVISVGFCAAPRRDRPAFGRPESDLPLH